MNCQGAVTEEQVSEVQCWRLRTSARTCLHPTHACPSHIPTHYTLPAHHTLPALTARHRRESERLRVEADLADLERQREELQSLLAVYTRE